MTHASIGQRFANFLIDLAVAYAGLCLISSIPVLLFWDSYGVFVYNNSDSWLFLYLFVVVHLVVIYTLIEGLTKGKTLGKLITRTRAVRKHDGGRIGWNEAFIRSIIRCVPFEFLSGYSGHPWHDRWSRTIVVREDSLRPVH